MIDELFKKILTVNNLSCLAISYLPAESQGTRPFTCYVHWNDHDCVGGSGETVEDAVKNALLRKKEETK